MVVEESLEIWQVNWIQPKKMVILLANAVQDLTQKTLDLFGHPFIQMTKQKN